jgi:phosphoenolpyruvate carboxykinase (ATP)
MYHFISGYTAKVAGTEMGVTEPQATFSPCFGGPFLVWHPMKYAGLLADKILKHRVNVWLVNTGWSGGAYGIGKRMKLSITRGIIDAIHSGVLRDAPATADPVFGLDAITACPGVPDNVLMPRDSWADKAAYDVTARKLAGLFAHNFRQYLDKVTSAVALAGPSE